MEMEPGKNCKKWHLNGKNFLIIIFFHIECTMLWNITLCSEPRSLVNVSAGEAFLAKPIAEEVKVLIEKGESDHAVALVFVTEGNWFHRAFLNTLRCITDGHRFVARDSNLTPETEQ